MLVHPLRQIFLADALGENGGAERIAPEIIDVERGLCQDFVDGALQLSELAITQSAVAHLVCKEVRKINSAVHHIKIILRRRV